MKNRAYHRASAADQEQTRQRQIAETKEKQSQQVAQFLKDMLASVEPSVALGRDATMLRKILDKTAERVGKDLKDQPEVQAELRSILGQVYHELGEFQKAYEMHGEALRLTSCNSQNTCTPTRSAMLMGRLPVRTGLTRPNLTDALAGKSPSLRKEFYYFNDDGSLVGLRHNQYKVVFAEQRAPSLDVWQDPFVPLRFPKLFNLRSDPFEEADHESIDYPRWRVEHVFVLVPAQEYVGKFLATFKEYPPSQKAGSFSLDKVMENLSRGAGDK